MRLLASALACLAGVLLVVDCWLLWRAEEPRPVNAIATASPLDQWLRVEERLEALVSRHDQATSAEVREIILEYEASARLTGALSRQVWYTKEVLGHCMLWVRGLETEDRLLVQQQVMALEKVLPNARAELVRVGERSKIGARGERRANYKNEGKS